MLPVSPLSILTLLNLSKNTSHVVISQTGEMTFYKNQFVSLEKKVQDKLLISYYQAMRLLEGR